jgi:hypothetical protein
MFITDLIWNPWYLKNGVFEETISIPAYPDRQLRINSHQCFANVQQNLNDFYIPLGLNLNTVVGSLAYFTNEQQIHYQWGDAEGNHTIDKHGSINAHCWLEDDIGNIYDFIGQDQLFLANEENITIANGVPILLSGVSKSFCSSQLNLYYFPASALKQESILQFINSSKMDIDFT